MNRKFFIVAALVLSSISPGFGFQNEPDGFMDVPWGSNIKDRSDMVFQIQLNDHETLYSQKNSNRSWGGMDFDKIIFVFFDGKFSRVMLRFRGWRQFQQAKSIFFNNFGDGKLTSTKPETIYSWSGKRATARLTFNPYDEDCWGYIASKAYSGKGTKKGR